MFGLAGASRTETATLAKEVANKLGIHFYDSSVARIIRNADVDDVADLAPAARITIEEDLLRCFIADIEHTPRPYITDRTPLDMIGDMLGGDLMLNSDAKLGSRIEAYVQRCLAATRMHFDTIFLVRPVGDRAADPDSRRLNRARQWQIHLLVEGAANQLCSVVIGTLTQKEFQARVTILNRLISGRIDYLVLQTQTPSRH